MDIEENIVDDAGTDQDEARSRLAAFCDNGFDGDRDRAALALGRTSTELNEMIDGVSEIDDDIAMKINGIARERGIRIG